MRTQRKIRVDIICLLAALVPGLAWADNGSEGQRPSGEHRRPPQEAFDACKDKSEGTSVEITTPRGTIKATCTSFGNELVAVPEGAPPPPNETSNQQ